MLHYNTVSPEKPFTLQSFKFICVREILSRLTRVKPDPIQCTTCFNIIQHLVNMHGPLVGSFRKM